MRQQSHLTPYMCNLYSRSIQFFPVYQHTTRNMNLFIRIQQTVQALEQSRLSTTRRTDNTGNLPVRNNCRHLFQNMIVLDSDIQMVYDNVRSFGIIGTKFLIRTKKTFFQFCFIQIGHIIPFDFLT